MVIVAGYNSTRRVEQDIMHTHPPTHPEAVKVQVINVVNLHTKKKSGRALCIGVKHSDNQKSNMCVLVY